MLRTQLFPYLDTPIEFTIIELPLHKGLRSVGVHLLLLSSLAWITEEYRIDPFRRLYRHREGPNIYGGLPTGGGP